jgi:predicted phosphodiesterase
MKIRMFFLLIASSCVVFMAAGPGGGKGGPGGGAAVEPAVVPDYLFNVILGRPGPDRITASVLAWRDLEGYLAYGPSGGALAQRTPEFKLPQGQALEVLIDKLKPDTQWQYQFNYRLPGSSEIYQDEIRTFRTQRAPASAFTFTIQADSHLDVSTDVNVYAQTLANMLEDRPDFLVDLGDTTMVDKFGPFYQRAETQYRAQRYYFGRIAHSVPLFLTLGNHDGETGTRLTGQPDSMPLWSLGMRKRYFPNPEPGGIYSGNSTPGNSGGLLQDYYAWEWGSALFVVLDPFWFTTERSGQDNWGMTLGEAQYRWLAKTLEGSHAPFKFIFIHHLVGGLGRDARGGAKPAPYMEWGGKNADGSEGFAQHRPGWEMPIHQLLVKNHVDVVFHGHDHLYAKEELDGIIYQEVPQPGHPSGGTRSAEEYGYSGVIFGSSGHLRVNVSPKETVVEYVRAAVPGITKADVVNRSVEHRYVIAP